MQKKEAMFRSFFGRVKQIVHDTTTEPYAGTNGAGAGKSQLAAPPIGWRNKEAQPPSSSSGAQARTGAVGSDRANATARGGERGRALWILHQFRHAGSAAALTDLVSDVNKYLAKFESSLAALLLRKIATRHANPQGARCGRGVGRHWISTRGRERIRQRGQGGDVAAIP